MIQFNFKLIFSLLITSLLTLSATAQTEVIEYYDNDSIQFTGFLDENDLQTGQWNYFYENGQVKIEEHYVRDTLNGEWKSYYENGELRVTGQYKNGKRTGEWKQRYENGVVGEVGNFVEGVFEGEGRFYYENGQLMKIFYSHSSETIEYDEDGNLIENNTEE